jgi:hypothetical protein
MRNPTQDELKPIRDALHAVARRQVEQQRELRSLLDAVDDAHQELQQLCEVPPGPKIDQAKGIWMDHENKPLIEE